MHLEPYLFFDGNCEEALAFYAAIFAGKVTGLMRFGDNPNAADMPPESHDKVMHASFTSPTLAFMASDGNRASECTGSRVALSLSSKDPADGERVFDALSAGGAVAMPYGKTFWGAMFGMLTDRYGIDWMINCELPVAM